MTPGEVTSIDQLRRSLDDLTETLKRRNTHRRVLAVLAGVAVALLLWNSFANRETLTRVKAATDPTGEYAERAVRNQSLVLAVMLDNIDCRDRRADAGLPPPPDAFRPCRDQTPAEVYSGPPLSPPGTPAG